MCRATCTSLPGAVSRNFGRGGGLEQDIPCPSNWSDGRSAPNRYFLTVTVTRLVAPSRVAPITEVVLDFWLYVVTVNVAELALAGTVMAIGTVATEVFELASGTIVPPDKAGAESVTVPVTFAPPTTVVGESVRLLRPGTLPAVAVIPTSKLSPFKPALMFARALAVCTYVITKNEAVVEPAGTTTFAGVAAAKLFELDNATVVPPDGAALVKVNVPIR